MDATAVPTGRWLSAEDLLAPSALTHDVDVPERILRPGVGETGEAPGRVRLRPLTIGTLAAISRAAREDARLVPLLIIKESLVEPSLSLDGVRALHVGLVQFLVSRVNEISGLTPDGELAEDAAASPAGQMHLLLARHFGWTPEQVAQLTPAQVAIYLAGAARLAELEPRE
ncbi:hypothetical protein OM076_37715 [Solirubrobacter ginsenosidimutans]|uniref:Uncharacterized protein n=1 Tax=Solirubrobacter ginsenosidimutans TaxID=490573 RepID=A0A9X3SAI6_9ACTN|nr:hypothetical protein [Solirubrobacter ginsenosidimutans]MDA0166063.1 hypothetical protein [Solirubrobacter ginsenosidimutans]